MASFVTFKSNGEAVAQELDGMGMRLRDPRPFLTELGERMREESIPRNFQEGGRPDKWAGTRRGGQIQRDSGALAASINFEVGGATLKVGTNNKYGPQRHFGGEIEAKGKNLAIPLDPNSKRRPKHYGARLKWSPGKPGAVHSANFRGLLVETVKGRGKKAKAQTIARFVLLKRVEQKPRPFLVWQTEDIAWAQREFVRHVVRRQFGVET